MNHSTLIRISSPHLGHLITDESLGRSNSSATDTPKASAILLRVSTVGFPLIARLKLSCLMPNLSASDETEKPFSLITSLILINDMILYVIHDFCAKIPYL